MKKNKSNSRKKDHPEIRSDEVFLGNVSWGNPDGVEIIRFLRSEYKEIGYKTKRLGNIAYDTSGRKIEGLKPVIVKEKEFNKSQKKSKNMIKV